MPFGKYHCYTCHNVGFVFCPPLNPLLWLAFWLNIYPCPKCAVPHRH